MNRANCYQPQFAWHWNAFIVLLLAIPLIKSGFTNHTSEARQAIKGNAPLVESMMVCNDPEPITRWNRLTSAQRSALNDNDPMTNVAGFHTGFCNGMGNPITVDISVAGAPNTANPNAINNRFPNRWGLTSFNNAREAGGNSGTMYCFNFSEPVPMIVNSEEHKFFHDGEHVRVSFEHTGVPVPVVGTLHNAFGPSTWSGTVTGSGTSEVHFAANQKRTVGLWWEASSNGNDVTQVCVEYYKQGPGQGFYGREPFTLFMCNSDRCLADDPFAVADPSNTDPIPGDDDVDNLTLTKEIACVRPAASGIAGNTDVTFLLTLTNSGNVNVDNLQLEDDLGDHVPDAALAAFVSANILPGMNTPPVLNPSFEGENSIRLFDGTSGMLAPNQSLEVELVVELDPNQLLQYDTLTNQSFAYGTDPSGSHVSAASDAPTGAPGNTGGSVDGTLLYIPSINVAKTALNYETSPACNAAGDIELTLQLNIQNTGNTLLDRIALQEALTAQLGAAFGSIVSAPSITASTATANPVLNAGFNGNAQTGIFNGTSGLLAQNQTLTVSLRLRLNPNAVGAILPALNQVNISARGLFPNQTAMPGCDSGNLLAINVSDAGTTPESQNPGAPGDTGGSNDALVLNLPGIGVSKQIISYTPALSMIAGNLDARFRIVVKNTGNVNLSNLALTDNLMAQLGSAFVNVVLAPSIVSSNATVNPVLGAFPNNIFNGASGLLQPNQTIMVDFVAELNPDAMAAPLPLINQAIASASGVGPAGVSITVSDNSDAGDDPEGINVGVPGNTGCDDDPLVVNLPALRIAKNIAGVDFATSHTSGNFDVITEVVVQNTGNVDLSNLHLIENLGAPSQLGSAFVAVVETPHIVPVGAHGTLTNAATNPGVNNAYNGNGDLLTGGGLLRPGQVFVVQFRYEVNPDAPGAPAFLKNQIDGSAQGLGIAGVTVTVNDLSDAGYQPQSNNTGWPGDTGGSNDPTPLTNCFNLLNNSITCNNNVQISLNQDCIASITPSMILEGEPAMCVNDDLLPLGVYYQIMTVTTLGGFLIPDLVPSTPNVYEVDGSYAGQTIIVKVIDVIYNNPCWGYATLEDKLGPIFDCSQPMQVNCNVDFNSIPAPIAIDNCDPNPVVTFLGQTVVDNNICNDGIYRVLRTYTAHDNRGNYSLTNCVQEVQLVRPPMDFPDDITWTCSQFGAFPDITDAAILNPAVVDTDPQASGINASPTLPNQVLDNTGSGVVNNMGGVCNYVITWEDDTVATCGNTLKIVRTWSVIDWCTSTVITIGANGEDNVQVIKVMDVTPPTISMAPFTINATHPGTHPQPCRSQGFLPPPTVSDGCGAVTIQIITPIGEAVYINGNPALGGFVPPPGLPLGVHTVVYKAYDACGNETSLNVTVTVVDDITPTAACDEFTDVSLTSTGIATVFAATFDDGSNDNCCIDHFEVRRMTDPCSDNHNDLLFGPSVVFCCSDVGAGPQQVVFRVFDCHGNYNDCMVQVTVYDKIAPVALSCPTPNVRITCDVFAEDFETQLAGLPTQTAKNEFLNQFGTATFYDNCSFIVTKGFSMNIDQCLEGVMTRTWIATDPGGLFSTSCTQNIFVDHVSDWVVEFAPDVTINCGDVLPNFVAPQIFYDECEMIATSWWDDTYTTVPGACFKVVRTWKIINWCVVGTDVNQEVIETPENALNLAFPLCDLDGDGDCDNRTFRDSWNAASKPGAQHANQSTNPDTDLDSDPWDGFITYQQVIKVMDATDPVFVAGCPSITVGIFDTICATTIVLDTPGVTDCSPVINIVANGDLGAGFGPFTNVGPGVYDVVFTATDNCNNQTTCASTITVVDSLPPSIKCEGIILVITDSMNPVVDLNVHLLDAGSADNCSDITFSFSPNDPTDTVMTFDCTDIPFDTVEVYVTDTTGNQDYCSVEIEVQDNNNSCGDDPLWVHLGGTLGTEDNEGVEDVEVLLSGQSNASMMSSNSGDFMFNNIPLGNDVTVTPVKDDNHLNGVTTYDLVLISKHILGVSSLGSPYKLIAADANKSGTVTTFDLVEIRKLILLINPEFPNNTSWRFIDKNYVFPNPANPFMQSFPEAINVNDIPADVLDAQFVAVKIGDVNNSADVNLAAGNEDRTVNGSLVFATDEVEMKAGETYTIAFNSPEFEAQGFQFTLNFDKNALEFVEVAPALAGQENFGFALLNEGVITTSWNGSTKPGEDEAVMQLVFKAKQTVKLSQAIQLNSRFTQAEAYDQDGNLMDVQMVFNNNSAATAGFELYQNVPNPFSEYTAIGFNLPESSTAELTITDVSGKMVKTVAGHFAKGYNEIRLSRQELPATGILYYRLDTPSGSATKMMLFMH